MQGSGFRIRQSGDSAIRRSGSAAELPQFPVAQSSPEPLIAPIIIVDQSPTGHYPLSTSHSSLGGWLFSYAAATVIMGMAILGAWVYKVSLGGGTGVASVHVATTDQPPSAPGKPERELVGRITGTADCRWADPESAPVGRDVALGQAYALASGLMEIAYRSGAKVILQGPCTYEVESAARRLPLVRQADGESGKGVRGQGSGVRPLSTSH